MSAADRPLASGGTRTARARPPIRHETATPPPLGPDAEWHYTQLDRLARVLQRPQPFERFLTEVLEVVRAMVGADAAWLLRDVVVDADRVHVVAETDDGDPSIPSGRPSLALDGPSRDLLAASCGRDRPARQVFAREADRGEVARRFRVWARMACAIRPTGELPWVLGLDRRTPGQPWRPAEQRLFAAVGDRVGQALVQRLLVERLQDELAARGRVEAALDDNERALRLLIDASPDIICFKDGEGRWLKANRADLELFELTEIAYQGLTDLELAAHTAPRFRDAFRGCVESDERAWASGGMCRGEEQIPLADGRFCVLDVIKVPVFHADGRRRGMIVIGRDITARREAEAAQRIAAAAMEHSGEAVVIIDRAGQVQQVNRAYERIFGRVRDDVVGHPCRAMPMANIAAGLEQRMSVALARDGRWSGEVPGLRASGEVFPLWMTVSALPDASGAISHYVTVAADISELRQSEAAVAHLRQHDPLTGLANRAGVDAVLSASLAGGPVPLQVVALDLDGFKHINASLGHAVGDRVLIEISERLRRLVGALGHVGRIGGDDFVLVVDPRRHGPAGTLEERLLALSGEPLRSVDGDLVVTWSLGIARCPADASEPEALLRCAVAAVNRAKSAGPGSWRHYDRAMTQEAAERVELAGALRRALSDGELRVVYQGIVDSARGRVVGVEALARWHHPVRGDISPERFIPLAEECGLIIQLGDAVLRTACAQAVAWLADGVELDFISVNVSGRQLDDPSFFERVGHVLADTGLAPQRLELEVTESVLMGRPDQALRTLKGLRAMGVRLAIDDFGTGYSSLAHLKRLPVHKLKLDRSFVSDLPEDAHDAAIARAVTALGHSLDFTIVAEGVETAEQFAFIRSIGCDQVQGFWCARPRAALQVSFKDFEGPIS